MARCEDFPCCGHELNCCPDFDESGNQLNMVCFCGAKLPIDSQVSICDGCLNQFDDDDRFGDELYENQQFEQADEYDDMFASDMEL